MSRAAQLGDHLRAPVPRNPCTVQSSSPMLICGCRTPPGGGGPNTWGEVRKDRVLSSSSPSANLAGEFESHRHGGRGYSGSRTRGQAAFQARRPAALPLSGCRLARTTSVTIEQQTRRGQGGRRHHRRAVVHLLLAGGRHRPQRSGFLRVLRRRHRRAGHRQAAPPGSSSASCCSASPCAPCTWKAAACSCAAASTSWCATPWARSWRSFRSPSLIFDYILTGPISVVSAGPVPGRACSTRSREHAASSLRTSIRTTSRPCFGVVVTVYFWWSNIKGIHESSGKALRIMQITTVMVVHLPDLVPAHAAAARPGAASAAPRPAEPALQPTRRWAGSRARSGRTIPVVGHHHRVRPLAALDERL